MKIRRMTYTKDSGDRSDRIIAVMSEPRQNLLAWDLTSLNPFDIDILHDTILEIETYRQECYRDFEDKTGIKLDSLWRSFKPEGIEWTTEDD